MSMDDKSFISSASESAYDGDDDDDDDDDDSIVCEYDESEANDCLHSISCTAIKATPLKLLIELASKLDAPNGCVFRQRKLLS